MNFAVVRLLGDFHCVDVNLLFCHFANLLAAVV